MRIGRNLVIEKEDAELLVEGQNATFINWGNLLIQKIKKENGNVIEIEAKLNLDNKDFKSTLKLTWLCVDKDNLIPSYAVYFEHIISKPVLGKEDDFKDFVAKDTRVNYFINSLIMIVFLKTSFCRGKSKCWVKSNSEKLLKAT